MRLPIALNPSWYTRPERTAEAKGWDPGSMTVCILLIDLGYFKYPFFDRIYRYGG